MLSLRYLLSAGWEWLTGTGLTLAILVVCTLLIPRVGRFVLWFINRQIDKNEEEVGPDEGKTQRAFAGVAVYIGQLVAFFLLSVLFLQTLGFSLTGAAIPATVASAAIGLGAQSIIADFLAGFFILTEKQFGVGDWVRFEGNGIEVEGTIIQVTMRATRIRTLAQETVIIPNSTARVCVNASNYWSRAVVVIPVPLLGSSDATEAINRSEAATRRALSRPEIAAELLGELDVQPAVDITPPTVVGMPWMVNMRFMIQVTAGNQWMVERAVRTEILDEFWDEYGSATTVSGELRDEVTTAEAPAQSRSQDTSKAMTAAPLIDIAYDRPEDTTETAATERISPADGAREDDSPTEVLRAPVPVNPGTGDMPEVPAGLSDEEGRDPARTKSETMSPAEEDEEEPSTEVPEEEQSRWRRILSLHGRVRASTTVLVALLAVLLLLRVFAIEPPEDWVERNQRAEQVETTPTEEEPTVTEPTGPTEPTTPTGTPEPSEPTDTTFPTEGTSSPTEGSDISPQQEPGTEPTGATGTAETGQPTQQNQAPQQGTAEPGPQVEPTPGTGGQTNGAGTATGESAPTF